MIAKRMCSCAKDLVQPLANVTFTCMASDPYKIAHTGCAKLDFGLGAAKGMEKRISVLLARVIVKAVLTINSKCLLVLLLDTAVWNKQVYRHVVLWSYSASAL